jgi:6-phosphofructokinase 1
VRIIATCETTNDDARHSGEEVLGASAETDESGNKKLPPVGIWFKEQVETYFKEQNPPINGAVKFIDPSYMIRSVPACSYDATLCLLLSQNAVHGAMAGYSGFCVGMCNDRVCYLPMKYIVENSPRQMNAKGRTWERVIGLTHQP